MLTEVLLYCLAAWRNRSNGTHQAPTWDVVSTNNRKIKLINYWGRVTMMGDCCKEGNLHSEAPLENLKFSDCNLILVHSRKYP